MPQKTFTLDEICQLVQLDKRTIRYYMQLGLVPHPTGETRAARYGETHVERLLQVRKWRDAGLSLERIAELLDGSPDPLPRRPRRGEIEVRSHITVGPGVEIQIAPNAGLTPEQTRALIHKITALIETSTLENENETPT
jgi:DNA-binding transcriptional MerR regulator